MNWALPCHNRILVILKNPDYAGGVPLMPALPPARASSKRSARKTGNDSAGTRPPTPLYATCSLPRPQGAQRSEARWNAALAQVAEAEARLQLLNASFQPLSESQRLRLLELGSDLRTAWEHPHAPVALKKRILRTVINEIVADVDESKRDLVFRIHWVGGVHSTLRLHQNRTGQHQRMTDRDVIERA